MGGDVGETGGLEKGNAVIRIYYVKNLFSFFKKIILCVSYIMCLDPIHFSVPSHPPSTFASPQKIVKKIKRKQGPNLKRE